MFVFLLCSQTNNLSDIFLLPGAAAHTSLQPLKLDPENSFFDEVLGWTIAAGGAYFQVKFFVSRVFLAAKRQPSSPSLGEILPNCPSPIRRRRQRKCKPSV